MLSSDYARTPSQASSEHWITVEPEQIFLIVTERLGCNGLLRISLLDKILV